MGKEEGEEGKSEHKSGMRARSQSLDQKVPIKDVWIVE